MANVKTTLDEWSVKDLEDGSSITITVLNCSELGNQSRPGIQVIYLGQTVNYEPGKVEQWAYRATKEGKNEYFLVDNSWIPNNDQFVKNYLILGKPLKARVEVKTRSSKLIMKEYNLPFEV